MQGQYDRRVGCCMGQIDVYITRPLRNVTLGHTGYWTMIDIWAKAESQHNVGEYKSVTIKQLPSWRWACYTSLCQLGEQWGT